MNAALTKRERDLMRDVALALRTCEPNSFPLNEADRHAAAALIEKKIAPATKREIAAARLADQREAVLSLAISLGTSTRAAAALIADESPLIGRNTTSILDIMARHPGADVATIAKEWAKERARRASKTQRAELLRIEAGRRKKPRKK